MTDIEEEEEDIVAVDEDVDEDELGPIEDAAGSDDDEDDDENIENDNELKEHTAHTDRYKVDPLLHTSNKSVKIQIVANENRVTDNRIHRPEATFCIATRARQIADYGFAFVDIGDLVDAGAIAFKEFYARKSPLILQRQIGVTLQGEPIVEEWIVREMALPNLTLPSVLATIRDKQ